MGRHAAADPVIWWHGWSSGNGQLFFRPAICPEGAIGNPAPKGNSGTILVLKGDRPRSRVPLDDHLRKLAADVSASSCGCNPERCDGSGLVLYAVNQGEGDRRLFAGVRVRTPRKVTNDVWIGQAVDESCLVAPVGIWQAVDDSRKVAAVRLPEPPHDLPLIVCDSAEYVVI